MIRAGAPGAGLVALLLASLAPSAARADEPGIPPARDRQGQRASPPDTPPRLAWDGFLRVGAVEGFSTVAFLAGTLPALFIRPSPSPWRGRDGFDEAWRNLVRAPGASTRKAADLASSVLVGASGAQLLVDAWAVAGVRGQGVAWQLTLVDAQAVALQLFLQTLVSHGASRERPYGRTCSSGSPPADADCTGDFRYQSFFSGHSSEAFTFAGLTCMHHAHLPLHGGGAPDAMACAVAAGAAVTVGVLRTVADKHYLSDVLTGAGIGALSGLGVPWLYYRTGAYRSILRDGRAGASVTVVPAPTGAAVVGAF